METAPWILVAAAGSLALWLVCLHLAGDRLARRFKVQRVTGPLEKVMSTGPVEPQPDQTPKKAVR
jgi:hypothetical protein